MVTSFEGLAAGMYSGLTYGLKKARGVHDWIKDTVDWVRSWKMTLFSLLEDVPNSFRALIASISIDGTSATTIIIDSTSGEPLWRPFLYNESCPDALPMVKTIAPIKIWMWKSDN